MKYDVTVCRLGTVTVEASNPTQAMDLVRKYTGIASDKIVWDDDWSVTDAVDASVYDEEED